MTFRFLVAGAFVLGGAAFAQDEAQQEQADVSYMLGYDVGGRLSQMQVELSFDRFMEGLRTAAAGEPSALSDERLAEVRAAFNERQQAAMAARQEAMRAELAEQAATNKAEGEAFLAENAQRDGIIVTDSGLQYEVVTMGEGEKPSAEDTVTVHYVGKLLDGTTFDSSVDRGEPATFALNRVIAGWTEGLQLMPVGSKFKFYIPAELAYGGRSMGQTIGPNSTLVFDVELLSIDND